jgi:hypothetical protein
MALSNSIGSRIVRSLNALRGNPTDIETLNRRLDTIEKERKSKLDIRNNDTDLTYTYSAFTMLRDWVNRAASKSPLSSEPPRGDPTRDNFLAEVWQLEPILAGAIYSMTAKMVSLKWSVTGKREHAVRYAKLLSRAAHMGGYDWGGFMTATAQDFYTTNRGVFWELAKSGDPLFSPMEDIGHIDSLQCTLTGNSKYPVTYIGYHNSQKIRFRPGEFIHFVSMMSPRERDLGAGICAVDRAFSAAKFLMHLHDYDNQKIDNLPPEGIATVTGMTMQDFQDAVKLWMTKRESDNSLTFPQVLWLVGSDPSANVGVNITGFSNLPESFDRKTVIEQYVNTIALAMGVDAREFWTYAGGGIGSTAGESEIQHLKAKGKGPGEFISTSERHINGELPEDTDFSYDTQDIEEDAAAAAIAKAWIDAYFMLYNLPQSEEDKEKKIEAIEKSKGNPRPDKPNGEPSLPIPMLPGVDTGGDMSSREGGQLKQAEQVITKDQFMRILADKGVLPDWMVTDDRIMIEDTMIHNQGFKSIGHKDDVTRISWKKGLLYEERVPGAIIINSPKIDVTVPDAIVDVSTDKSLDDKNIDDESYARVLGYLKEKKAQIVLERNIVGDPIPELESTRGSKPNRKTIHDELELWRNHPILSQYAMSVEEENKLFGELK